MMRKDKEVSLTFSGSEIESVDIYGTSIDSVDVRVDREELLEELGYNQNVRIRNLEDEIKYDLLIKNFEKMTLKQVENFIEGISKKM